MQIDILALVFIVYLFVLMPRAALSSARYLRTLEGEGKPRPSRSRILLSTLVSLGLMFAMTFINARSRGRNLFEVPAIGVREIGFAVLALGLLLATIPVSRAMRSAEERRRMAVLGLAPRTGQEWAMFAAVAAGAGIAEESAYRGVAIWILAPIVGGVVPAALLSATAFAVSHAMQGAKSMALVFVIAIVCQGLVYFSGTLVLAMIVHTTYDLIAGYLTSRRAMQYEREAAAAAPAAPNAG